MHPLARSLVLLLALPACHSTDRRPRLGPGPELARVSDPEDRRRIGLAVEDLFGVPDAPLAPEGSGLDLVKLERGRALSKDVCVSCHGEIGEGPERGGHGEETAVRANPRDWRRAVFKFTSTAPTAKPVRSDLAATLRRGVPPVMPSVGLLPEQKIDDVVEGVVWCAERGEVERRLVAALVPGEAPSRKSQREAVAATGAAWSDAENQVTVPLKIAPPMTPQLARWGRELFLSREAGCSRCHGNDGRGTSPTAQELKDDWGESAPPPDLTRGNFACGSEPSDLYRAIAAGLKGTSMPAYRSALASDQIWDLVAYLRELGDAH